MICIGMILAETLIKGQDCNDLNGSVLKLIKIPNMSRALFKSTWFLLTIQQQTGFNECKQKLHLRIGKIHVFLLLMKG